MAPDASPQASDVPAPPQTPLAWRGDWRDGVLEILDQTLLPGREVRRERRLAAEVVEDIRRLAVRGAPLIGIAGAYALVFAAREAAAGESETFTRRLAAAAATIRGARPTAVNLSRAVDRGLARAAGAATGGPTAEALLEAAQEGEAYETSACAAIGRHGAAWLGARRRFLTHCNAGALVTPGIGTALAPLYVLHHRGEGIHVWVDETRPLLQGLRLTAYELGKAGISHAVIVEGAAATLLARGEVDAVLVGADRIARNGDVANKIGTYPLAIAARHHGVPFLVAAPLTTLDPSTASGGAIPIEDRPLDPDLYLSPGTRPGGTRLFAPAFDVTPAGLVTALVTEEGVLASPSTEALTPWMDRAGSLQAREHHGR